jgi:hypothetical protein
VLAWIQKLAEDFDGHLTDPELDPRLRARYSREVRGVLRDVAVTPSIPDPAATVPPEEKITRPRGMCRRNRDGISCDSSREWND